MTFDNSYLCSVLAVIGLYCVVKNVAKISWELLNGIRVHFIGKIFFRDIKIQYGKWAVVTGGTDGIGKAYARELARRGVNVALVSRSLDKLKHVAQEIEKDFGVETKIIQADFSLGQQVYQGIEEKLKSIEVGLLVNNVGVIVPYPMLTCEMTSAQLCAHVNVNVGAATFMTSMLLPDMLRRRRGAIVNVSSLASLSPLPYLGVYAATKAYVESFSSALQFECRGSGVHIQTLTPSYVNTNMVSYSPKLTVSSLMVPAPHTYARHAVNTLGKTSMSTGYWPHGIQYWVCTLFPRWAWLNLSGRVNRRFREEYDALNASRKTQ